MIVGFTGTREGMTNEQIAYLVTILDRDGHVTEVHHGACVGADATVHKLANSANLWIHVWPPTNMKYVATECLSPPYGRVTIHDRMPYLDRDRQIVSATEGLVAFPKQNEQPDRASWGGTWYTVNFAERVRKPVVIVYPNGVVEQRFPQVSSNTINPLGGGMQ